MRSRADVAAAGAGQPADDLAPQVVRLGFEHHRAALGIGEPAPRLTWATVAGEGWVQAGYEVAVDRAGRTTTTGWVEGTDSLLVPWPGEPLRSRERAEVRVRVCGVDGRESGWSAPAVVEAGLLSPEDWSAVPVGPGPGTPPDGVWLLRREFAVREDLVAARLYLTAHGVAEAEVNGAPVGDDVLAPGWTSYDSRLQYATHDVTDLLRPGANALGVRLADGWYRGLVGFEGGTREIYGDRVAVLCQLELHHADGSTAVVASGPEGWTALPAPTTSASFYAGERHDARADVDGWSSPGSPVGDWRPATDVSPRDPATLVAPEGPPVRRTEELAPVSVTPLEPGTFLLDFGQNLVGRLRLRVDGPAGTVLRLRHAEVLEDGRLCTRPLREAASVDEYVLAGGGPEEWEPHFTLHGFRYAEVSGWPGELDPGAVTARVHHTDMERTGWFACSDPLVTRLHENVVWSMRGNFVHVPTDCPQRDERLGWTGDIQVFAPTAAFLYDCAGMLRSWLRDLAAEQLPDGTVPWYVPYVPGGQMWSPPQPGAVWGDAAVLTPWVLFERFGDRQVLADQYPSARAWVDLVEQLAGPDRVWDRGFQLGDWLDPAAPPEDPTASVTDPYLVATAYFAWSAEHLARTAAEIGRGEDAVRHAALAEEVRHAFRSRYVTAAGRLTSDTQTAYALAICFDLLLPEHRTAAGARLAHLVHTAGNRIATGFAGTPLVTEALARTGQVSAAYDLLLSQDCPSWLYTVRQGGTTIWERWDSLLPDGSVNPGDMTSFNHYALGAVADWLHRTVAGLAPAEPGYRRVSFRPQPGGGLTWARARHTSPYGPVAIEWHWTEGRLDVEVEVPTGTTATVELPLQAPREVGPGRHRLTADVPPDWADR
ncbi:glycoside hydrolase family 78 protein [Modestobacter italicus]|uniref:glycoside hydrolase family 78 protein n=1 Tax=Modestobacter italicus (strain DSM 44449 / CECT 9708 / BC 501) TaxID=2732864 RepID=UPI0027DF3517|nr:glycoside hydrolase family 78 protein [Modestobacter italicus]